MLSEIDPPLLVETDPPAHRSRSLKPPAERLRRSPTPDAASGAGRVKDWRGSEATRALEAAGRGWRR